MIFSKTLFTTLSNIFKINMGNIKTFAFIDSETTGLPHLENCKTKITELCIVVVHTSHLSLGVYPRVQNKLNLCFNPRKYINKDVSEITGLDNYLLENQTHFQASTVKLINQFLEAQEKPICFVAHNGNHFDYPILRTEIHRVGQSLSDDILCIDSLEAFREFHRQAVEETEIFQETVVSSSNSSVPPEFEDGYDELLCNIVDEMEQCSRDGEKMGIEEIRRRNETTPQKITIRVRRDLFPSTSSAQDTSIRTAVRKTVARKLDFGRVSFKLGQVYERLTTKKITDAHKAEGDVNMLISCAATYGQKFVDWADENARPFNEIPLLQIGKKIGS